MVRLYERHQERKTSFLDGFWQFITDPDNKGEDEKWYRKFPAGCRRQMVPGCWNTSLGLFDYEGKAWYFRRFKTEKENIKLRFHGVSGLCRVYLDGNLLGEHYGGFTGFDFSVTGIEPGYHSLTLMVDSAPNTVDTIPLERVDWKHYGGIIRSVEVMELDPIWIDLFTIDYSLSGSTADVAFMLTLSHSGDQKKELPLKIYAENTVLVDEEISVSPGDSGLRYTAVLEDVRIWNPENPQLYTFRVQLGRDDIIERTGFRTVKAADSRLLVNGKPVVLKGVNRHEEHPDWGFSVPPNLTKRDLDIIMNLGCNSVRGSHYPNSELFLDFCDEHGIMFWEEIPMWGFPEEALANETVLNRGLAMHEEMIRRDRHHPSIIMWGMHNEVDTRTQAGYDLTKKFTEKVRGLDSSRPLTFATMHPLDDICLPLVDIASVNSYHGWYHSTLEHWSGFLGKFKEKLAADGLEKMPIIMSEFGAGAVYGTRSFEGPRWTENYQEKYLEHTLNLFLNDERIIGTYIWQYCDIRTAKVMELSRPRSFNNKGIVNEYRQPKEAYWKVREFYRG